MEAVKQIFIRSKKLPKVKESNKAYNTSIDSATKAIFASQALLKNQDTESFIVVPVDNNLKPLGVEIVAQGGINYCTVDLKLIFRSSILLGAIGFICVHNHPSEILEPSNEDIELTKKIFNCSKILGLQFFDHIIITEDDYISIRDKFDNLFN